MKLKSNRSFDDWVKSGELLHKVAYEGISPWKNCATSFKCLEKDFQVFHLFRKQIFWRSTKMHSSIIFLSVVFDSAKNFSCSIFLICKVFFNCVKHFYSVFRCMKTVKWRRKMIWNFGCDLNFDLTIFLHNFLHAFRKKEEENKRAMQKSKRGQGEKIQKI